MARAFASEVIASMATSMALTIRCAEPADWWTGDQLVLKFTLYGRLTYTGRWRTHRSPTTVDRHKYVRDESYAVRHSSREQVYGNYLRECRSFGVKIMESPQEKICGNTIQVPDGEDPDDVRRKRTNVVAAWFRLQSKKRKHERT